MRQSNRTDLTRRRFLGTTLASAMPAMLPVFAKDSDPLSPVDVASEPLLLIDDWLLSEQRGLTRTLHSPRKQGLIKEADGRDWERGDPFHGCIACRDSNGRFHLTFRYSWPDMSLKDHPSPSINRDKIHWFRFSIGYAYSDDGIHWTRPPLGLIEAPTGFRHQEEYPVWVPTGFSRENSLGCPIAFAYDLHAHGNSGDPEQRFLVRVSRRDDTHYFAGYVEDNWYFAADWPDFAGDPQWREKLTPITDGKAPPRGMMKLCGFDHEADEWFAVHQDFIGGWLPRNGRDIARTASPDLREWSRPQLVLPVAEDERKEPDDWVEYMDIDAYRVGGPQAGLWLGQLLVFHSDRSDPLYQAPHIKSAWRKGLTELRLVSSRDAGRSWQPVCGKSVWLPCHDDPHGYDRLLFGQYPIRVGDESWLYYGCWDGDHMTLKADGSLLEPGVMRTGRTALATLRWNGYVSLDAGPDGGSLTTRPLRFKGNRLTINADASGGRLVAAILDVDGHPIDRFGAEDCTPITSDAVRHEVKWRNAADVSSLTGKTVRLRLEFDSAQVYTFQFS